MVVRLASLSLYQVVNYEPLLRLSAILAAPPIPLKGKKAMSTP